MENQPQPIYETRDERMVSFQTGKSTARTARFLRPLAKQINKAIAIPKTPLLSEILPHNNQQWPSKVHFKGWHFPQKKWKQWVDKLSQKCSSIWIQTGICDAILSSIYEVHCNHDLLLGLSEFWCADTNTFVFPWGEATVTLEDVSILGGYPILGEPINSPLSGGLSTIVDELNKNRVLISRSRAKKAEHSGWLKHFMEETQSDFEHVAFLSLWLSRYVFPSLADETLGKHVFPIAAKLSKGIQVAIGPAVLASLYRDFRTIREQAMASNETIRVSGPFQLVQIWAFERFRIVGPKALDSIQPGEPRAARWHRLNTKLNVPLVRLALKLGENFEWRPYAANLKNWKHPSYYKETDQLMVDCSSLDDQDLRSFIRCLQCCELVGIDCKEKYQPHRVAMQFGMDQDLPGDFANFNISNYFVPSRFCQPGVSMRYSNWWTNMMMAREGAIKGTLLRKRDLDKPSEVSKKPSCGNSDTVAVPHPTVKKQVCDDSSDDNVPIATRNRELWNQSRNSGSVTVNGSSGTRMSSAVKEGNFLKKGTIQSVKSGATEIERKVDRYPNNKNWFRREAKREYTWSNAAEPSHGIKLSKERNDVEDGLPPRSVYWPNVVSIPPSLSKVPQSARAKRSKYWIPLSPKKSSNNAQIATSKKPHSSVSKKTSSSPLVHSQNSSEKAFSSTRYTSKEQSRERRPFPPNEGNVVTKSTGGRKIGKEVKQKDSNITAAQEVKKRAGEPLDPLDFAILSQRIKQRKGSRESFKGKKGEGFEAGESRSNPINVNIYMDNSPSKYQGLEFEGRMQRIEKLLGVKPGCSGQENKQF